MGGRIMFGKARASSPHERHRARVTTVAAAMALAACTEPVPPRTVGPVLDAVAPNVVPAGELTAITLRGGGFGEDVSVAFTSPFMAVRPTWRSPSELVVAIPDSLIAEPRILGVTVFSGTGLPSRSLPIAVVSPAPTIDSISPASLDPVHRELRIFGTGLHSRSIVRWNGEARQTLAVWEGGKITLVIPLLPADVQVQGTVTLTVLNEPEPAPWPPLGTSDGGQATREVQVGTRPLGHVTGESLTSVSSRSVDGGPPGVGRIAASRGTRFHATANDPYLLLGGSGTVDATGGSLTFSRWFTVNHFADTLGRPIATSEDGTSVYVGGSACNNHYCHALFPALWVRRSDGTRRDSVPLPAFATEIVAEGSRIWIGTAGGGIHVVDTASLAASPIDVGLLSPGLPITGMVADTVRDVLLVTMKDEPLVWSIDLGGRSVSRLYRLPFVPARIASAALTGELFIVASDGGLEVLDLESGSHVPFGMAPSAIHDVAVSPDGEQVAIASGDAHEVLLYARRDGTLQRSIPLSDPPARLAYADFGRALLVASGLPLVHVIR